jgi:hypothetical protein
VSDRIGYRSAGVKAGRLSKRGVDLFVSGKVTT